MKIVFAGTPDFAAVALKALLGAGHDVALVLTQPDRPAGRGLHARASSVKRVAQDHALPVLQPATLMEQQTAESIADLAPDALIVAAFGLMLPQTILAIPRLSGINIHASLLPRWRGAAPIQRAILAGDPETGISIMQMDSGLDTGAVLLQQALAIEDEDTAQTLHDRLAVLGGHLVVRALSGPLVARPQDDTLATYARKITKQEALVDWSESAEIIARKVRAFNPIPGAASMFAGTPIKIWRAQIERGVSSAPGTVLEVGVSGILVACGHEGLRLQELQRAGGKRLPAKTFISGFELARGARFGA